MSQTTRREKKTTTSDSGKWGLAGAKCSGFCLLSSDSPAESCSHSSTQTQEQRLALSLLWRWIARCNHSLCVCIEMRDRESGEILLQVKRDPQVLIQRCLLRRGTAGVDCVVLYAGARTSMLLSGDVWMRWSVPPVERAKHIKVRAWFGFVSCKLDAPQASAWLLTGVRCVQLGMNMPC